jgi:hypothetical protein
MEEIFDRCKVILMFVLSCHYDDGAFDSMNLAVYY